MNITKEEFNGIDSCSPDSKLFFTQGEKMPNDIIISIKRIGIDYAEGDKDLLLRFTLKEDY